MEQSPADFCGGGSPFGTGGQMKETCEARGSVSEIIHGAGGTEPIARAVSDKVVVPPPTLL